MPIYEYRCTSCGHTLEVIQKFNDDPLKKCTECPGTLEKLISRSAFQLKGGGWYSQGYAGGTGPSSSVAPASPSKSTSTESSGSKPDTGKKAASGGGCGSGTCGCH